MNNNAVKSCFVEQQTNEGIEIMTIRLELKRNKTISNVLIMGNKKPKL